MTADPGPGFPPHHRRTGFLTQSYNLFPHLTVAGNIGYGLCRAGVTSAEINGRVQGVGGEFSTEPAWKTADPRRFRGDNSNGRPWRGPWLPQPDLMLLDEPFNSLDVELRRTLRNELRKSLSAKRRIPAILVTHDIEEAISMGDMVQVLENGRVIEKRQSPGNTGPARPGKGGPPGRR